jgi:hypothetical protein
MGNRPDTRGDAFGALGARLALENARVVEGFSYGRE